MRSLILKGAMSFTGDAPRLFCMHFWALDTPGELATLLKAPLDPTNSQK